MKLCSNIKHHQTVCREQEPEGTSHLLSDRGLHLGEVVGMFLAIYWGGRIEIIMGAGHIF